MKEIYYVRELTLILRSYLDPQNPSFSPEKAHKVSAEIFDVLTHIVVDKTGPI